MSYLREWGRRANSTRSLNREKALRAVLESSTFYARPYRKEKPSTVFFVYASVIARNVVRQAKAQKCRAKDTSPTIPEVYGEIDI